MHHFVIFRKIKSLCSDLRNNSIVGQIYFKNKLKEKEIRFVGTRGEVEGGGIG